MAKLSTLDAILYRPPPPGCVLSLMGRPFSGGTIQDNSPYGNHGTVIGATWVKNECGLWVFDEDGIDDVVTIADNNSLQFTNSFTLSGWYYVDAFGTYNCFMGKFNGWTQGYVFRFTSTQFTFEWNDTVLGAVGIYENVSVSLGEWFLASMVKDEKNIIFYKNGVKASTTATTGGIIVTGDRVFQIGGAIAGFTQTFYNGKFGLPKAINRALSAPEIATIYNRERYLFGV